MDSLFLFPFSLLRSSVSIFIVLGLSLAISAGDANASEDFAHRVQTMVSELQQLRQNKTEPAKYIEWLSGDGKSFPFDAAAAKSLVRELCLLPKLYGVMVEIPYLRTALKNHKTRNKSFLLNFFAQRICENIGKSEAEKSLNSDRIAFSHLVRAYQIDNPSLGPFPIDSSILKLTSINELDFVVPGQPIPASLNWFFDNYENSSGQRFRPAAPSSTAGFGTHPEDDKLAVAVTAVTTSAAGGPKDVAMTVEAMPSTTDPASLGESTQTEQERDEAEVIRLTEIWSRVAAARLSGQDPTVDRGAMPIVGDILSDVKKIGPSTPAGRTKAKKLELQIRVFPEIFRDAAAKEIALYPFLHEAMLGHTESRQALIEFKRSGGKSWLQYSSNLILSNTLEKYKVASRKIFVNMVQAHQMNGVPITADTLDLKSIPDKSVFGETNPHLEWFFNTYTNGAGQGFNGSSPVTVAIPVDDYDADEPDTLGAASSFGVASTVADDKDDKPTIVSGEETARHFEIKEQLEILPELDTGVLAKIWQSIKDMPVYNDNPVFEDESGRNAHLAGIAAIYAQSVINGKPARLLELIPEAYPLLIADLSGKGVLESYQTDDGSNLLEYHLGFDSSGAIVNTLLDAGLFNDPHGLDGFASADDYDSEDDVGDSIVPLHRTTDHNQVNAYALSQLFSLIEVRNTIKQQALMDTEMSWDYRPHLQAVEGNLVSILNSNPQLLETFPDIYGILNDYPELKKTLREYRLAGKTLLQYHMDQGNPWAVAALFDSYYTAEYVITHRELDLRQGTDLAVFDQVRPEYYQRFFKEYKNSEGYSVPELSGDVGIVVQSLTNKGIKAYEKEGFYSTEERMIIQRARLYFERMYKNHYFEPRSSSDVPSDTVGIPRFKEELESFRRLFDANPLVIHAADAEGYVPYITSLYVYMARQDDRAKDFLKSSPNILTSCLENAVRYGSKKFAEGFLEEEGNFVMIFGRLLDIFSEDGSIPSLRMPKSPLLWHFSGASPETQRRFFIGYRDYDGLNVTHFLPTMNTNFLGRTIIGNSPEDRQIFYNLLQEMPRRGEPSIYWHSKGLTDPTNLFNIPELTRYLRLENLLKLYPDIVKFEGYRDALRAYRISDGRSCLQFLADSLMDIQYPELPKRRVLEDVSCVVPMVENGSLTLATLILSAPQDREKRQHLEAFQTLVRAYMLDNGYIDANELNLGQAFYWMFQELPEEIQREFFISYRNSAGQTILPLLSPSERNRVQDVVSNVWDYKRLLQGLPYFSLDDPAAFMGYIKQINDQRVAARWADPDLESQYKSEIDRLIKYITMSPVCRRGLFIAHSLLDQVPEFYPHLLFHGIDRDTLRRHSVDGAPLIQYVANKVQRGEGFKGDHFSALIRAYYEDKNEINAETLDLTAISSLNQFFGSSINQPYVKEFYLKYRNRQGQNIAHLLPVTQLGELSKALDLWGIIYLMSSKDLSGQTPVEKASLTEIEVYRKLMSSVAARQSDDYLDREEEGVDEPFSARAVEARVVLTAQSLEDEDLNPSGFEKVWRSPYFDKRSGKAIDHEDFVNVLITMARLKADKRGPSALVPLAFLQDSVEHKDEARRLWKDVLAEHDRFLDMQKDTFPEEYRKAQEEKKLLTGYRVLKFVSNACSKFPGDETRVKMASKLIATGGIFGVRSKRLDFQEAATLVEACEKVAQGYVKNLMGQSVRPTLKGLKEVDADIAQVEVFLGQVNEVIEKDVGHLVVSVLGDDHLDFATIKKEFEDHKTQLLAQRVVLADEENTSKQQHFIQTFKNALVKLKDIFFSQGLSSGMSSSMLSNRVLNHQRTCTVISMFSVLKGLETQNPMVLDSVLPTMRASSGLLEDRMFNCIDEIFALSELGVAPAKTSRQLFASACSHLNPDFVFSFGGHAGQYVNAPLKTGPSSDSYDVYG